MRDMLPVSDTLTVFEIMDTWPETISVFLQFKMLCVGCSVAPFHTIEEACMEHEISEDAFRDALQSAIKGAET